MLVFVTASASHAGLLSIIAILRVGLRNWDTGFSTDMTIKCLTVNIGKLSQHPAAKSRAKGCSLVALEVGLWKFP